MKKTYFLLFALAFFAIDTNAQIIQFDNLNSNLGVGKILVFNVNNGAMRTGYRFISDGSISASLKLQVNTHNTWGDIMVFNGLNVGIGTLNPDSKLTVKGKIHAEEVKVDLNVPADYVFQKYFDGYSEINPKYNMLTLVEIESFIKVNKHLPEIPSAKEIQQEGLYLGEMTNLLLQKIEELTLYTIDQEKRIAVMESKLSQRE
jgi:hypothetical protein